jgi:hypothetical protein
MQLHLLVSALLSHAVLLLLMSCAVLCYAMLCASAALCDCDSLPQHTQAGWGLPEPAWV